MIRARRLPMLIGGLVLLAIGALLFWPRGTTHGRQAAPAAAVGHPAPNFTLARLDGGRTSLRAWRGKVVVLNLWATWCIPCRHEIPTLMRWYRQSKSRGLVVLGVDRQEPAGDVRSFLRSLSATYPVALDSAGSVADTYRAFALPLSYVIDRQGIIRAINYGAVDAAFWRRRVLPLLST